MRLYVADWRSGLEIWDVRDPQNPVRLSSVPVYYAGTSSDQPTDGLHLVGDFLYVNANEARVHAFDVSDPANPVDLGVQAGPLWYYTHERDTDDVAAGGGYVYVAGSGLAKFLIRPDGTLEKVGENLYIETTASGPVQSGTPGIEGLGSLVQGALEGSNVNVVAELVNMIETQRAYEMNSKAITTNDQMMQYINNNL